MVVVVVVFLLRSAFAEPAAVGNQPASQMHFDNMSASSPMSNRSFFQPFGGLDDKTVTGAAFQVVTCVFHVYLYSFCNFCHCL